MPGFGGGGFGGPRGMITSEPVGNPEYNLHQIKSKLCLPPLMEQARFDFPSSGFTPLRVELAVGFINSVLPSVWSGSVGIFLGEADAKSTYPLIVAGAGQTIQYFIPANNYVFTLVPIGGAASGTITFMAL